MFMLKVIFRMLRRLNEATPKHVLQNYEQKLYLRPIILNLLFMVISCVKVMMWDRMII